MRKTSSRPQNSSLQEYDAITTNKEFRPVELNYRLYLLERRKQKLLDKIDTLQNSSSSLSTAEITRKIHAFNYMKEELLQKKKLIESYLDPSENFTELSQAFQKTQDRITKYKSLDENEVQNSRDVSYKYDLLHSLELYKDNITQLKDKAHSYFQYLKQHAYEIEKKRLDLKEKKFKKVITKGDYYLELEDLNIQKKKIRDKLLYLSRQILSF